MPSFQKLVILFTRYPQLGKCKTRLIPVLGERGAVNIHRQLVFHTLDTLKKFLVSQDNTSLSIYYDGGTLAQMTTWLRDDYIFKSQQGDNLGNRMATALIHGLRNHQNTILIGSDCPGITPDILCNSLQALKHKDVVIGPAHDGGYYLIGVAENMTHNICRQIFRDIPWGTNQVFSKTMRQVNDLGLSTHILTKLHDIDTAADLKYFHHCPHTQ